MNYPIQENGRVLSTQFDGLPARSRFPVYYEKITNPMTMHDIRERIETYHYKTSDKLMADFTMMFQNAHEYYPAGSEIVSDASTLEQIAVDATKRVTNGIVLKIPAHPSGPTALAGGDSKPERPGPSKPMEPKAHLDQGLSKDLRRVYYGTSDSDNDRDDPSYTPEWVCCKIRTGKNALKSDVLWKHRRIILSTLIFS